MDPRACIFLRPSGFRMSDTHTPSEPGAISMKDLARQANCSVNTVSLALRDSPRISTEARARIQKLARDTGYRPNPLISALVSTRRKSAEQTIALITKFERPFHELEGPRYFDLELLRGMKDKASELGFRIEEFPTMLPDSPSAERLTNILLARGIRGVLLFPSGHVSVNFPTLDWRHFAVVAAGFHASQWPVHRTALDQSRSVELCLARLTELGFTRIGFAVSRFFDPRWNYAASGRFLVWQARQPKRNLIPVVPCDQEFPTADEFEAWVVRHQPEAVILMHDAYLTGLEAVNVKYGWDIVPVVITSTSRLDVAGAPARPDLLGRASISVLARELYLNHSGVPATPEVTLVSSEWRDSARLVSQAPKAGKTHPSTPAGTPRERTFQTNH